MSWRYLSAFDIFLSYLLEYRGVLGDIIKVQKLRKVIEYMEGSNVEFVLWGKNRENYNSSRFDMFVIFYSEFDEGGHENGECD